MDRALSDVGMIRRKRRKLFEHYLRHENERVHDLAATIWCRDLAERAWFRAAVEMDEDALDLEHLEYLARLGRPPGTA